MTTSTIDSFASQAADKALRGAIDLLGRDTVRALDDAGLDRLVALVRTEVKGRVGKALDDAREALDVMPGAVGLATAGFAADMTIAGIEAAKRFQAG